MSYNRIATALSKVVVPISLILPRNVSLSTRKSLLESDIKACPAAGRTQLKPFRADDVVVLPSPGNSDVACLALPPHLTVTPSQFMWQLQECRQGCGEES